MNASHTQLESLWLLGVLIIAWWIKRSVKHNV